MYTPDNNFRYYQYAPPVPPQEGEKRQLRSTALRIGVVLLTLIASMQLIYPIVVVVLMSVGILPKDALTANMLGVDNATFLTIYSVVYAIAMGVPLLIVAFGKNRVAPFSLSKPVRFDVAFLGIVGGVGCCMTANIITSYILAFFEQFGITAPEAPEMMVNHPGSYFLNLFTIAVLPALLEEAVFRGCVLRLLRPYGDWFAIVVSAVVFGLMHGNLRQIPFATIVGLVLGLLYVITNNIWIPVTVHFINNAVSVSMEYLGFSMSENTVGVFYTLLILALAFVGLSAGVVLMIARRRYLRLQPNTTHLSGGERYGTLLKAPTFLIALILYVVLTVLGM